MEIYMTSEKGTDVSTAEISKCQKRTHLSVYLTLEFHNYCTTLQNYTLHIEKLISVYHSLYSIDFEFSNEQGTKRLKIASRV